MLSTTAEYALRIMVVLAEAHGEPRTSERIAGMTAVPTDYSVKVLQMLARSGLVRAQRGRGGGFRLACDPELTSLLHIINAIEPIARTKGCPLGRDLQQGRLCALHQSVDDAIAAMRDRLGRRMLADVLSDSGAPCLCAPTPVAVSPNGNAV